ncbi:MAG: FAD-binding protein [Anaerolineae bacterium]
MDQPARSRCDVLVIGGGGAALRAAIAAAEADTSLRVTIATKGELGRSGVTANACSDRMAFHATLPTTEPREPDSWRFHADDVYRIGGYVSDYDLAEAQARGAAEAFAYLDAIGVPWARRADGSVDQFVTDGSAYARACYTGPYTANHIEAALLRRLKQLPNVSVVEHVCAVDLLRGSDGAVAGALFVGEGDDGVLAVNSAAVILATGGAGQVFAVNVFTPDCTGDGYAMAYRAGASLVNMEFIQIGLCSLATGLAMSGDAMRALPRFVDENGREFLRDYFPTSVSDADMYATVFAKGASWPVSYEHTTHVLDIAVSYELAAGHRVYLDYGANPAGLVVDDLPDSVRLWYTRTKAVPLADAPYRDSPLARLQAINAPSVQWLAERGVRLAASDRAEIAPAIQHFQGGVRIHANAETSLPGLFAAGEVAGGQHGANRPGGNALMDGQVFGRIAGEAGADRARAGLPAIDEDSLARALAGVTALAGSGTPAAAVRPRVQALMSGAAAVIRTASQLEEALGELAAVTSAPIAATGASTAYAIETRNITCVAEMVLRAALTRDESRGPHLRFAAFGDRLPLPSRDDWRRYIVIERAPDGMSLTVARPVPPPEAS